MIEGLLVAAAMAAVPLKDPACVTSASPQSLAKRASPLDSIAFAVGEARVKICYSRPSARGRTMIGGYNVPWDRIWRTGANEPTMIHASAPIRVAGIPVPAGTYSFYTVPGRASWEIIVNRSTEQWGDEGSYTKSVKDQEVGRGTVASMKLDQHVEQLTFRTEPRGGSGGMTLFLEWEYVRVPIPVEPGR